MNYQLITALGLRVYPNHLGQLRLPEGGYGRERNGKWLLRPPACDTVELAAERVLEHQDGTVSVHGRIDALDAVSTGWTLERGVWTSLDAQLALTQPQ